MDDYPTLEDLRAGDAEGVRTIAVGGPSNATQYDLEVQRAQRGSGYIAPNVSLTGEVITGAYDPVPDRLREAQAQELAMRYEGQRLYHSLVQGGATPAEAYRAAGHKLNYSNPLAQVKLDSMLDKQRRPLLSPEVQSVDGVKMFRSGPNSWARVPDPRTATSKPVKMPPDVAVQQKNLQGQITTARKDLERATRDAEKSPEAARRALAYRDQLAALEQQAVVASTNWMAKGGVPIPELNPNVDQAGWNQIKDAWNTPAVTPQAGPVNPVAPTTPKAETPAPAEAREEVVRLVKGRRAVYDAATKQFLRWAD